MNRMQNWFSNLSKTMQSWMYGRYGYDELNRFLTIGGLVLLMISMSVTVYSPTASSVISGLAIAMYALSVYRTYSRNISKRQQERASYLRRTEPVRAWCRLRKSKFTDRKTHRYFKCRQCKTVLRVPKGKGKIRICCRSCGAELMKKT